MRVPAFLVVAAIVIWALLEAFQADSRDIRRLPKALWVVIIILLAPIGPLAWFVFGRPKVPAASSPHTHPSGAYGARAAHPSRREQAPRPAPDDDPEFLRRLSQQAEQQKMLRLLEEGPPADEPRKPGADDEPGEGPKK